MIYRIDLLISGQELVTITEDDLVRDALTLMVIHDFSQLPVVNMHGSLTRLISDQSISRNYLHLGDDVGLLDLKVADCCEKPETLARESDVLDALSLLKRTASVVIVNDKRPVGIVTNTDATEFFRDLAEGLVLIEDMEVTLRQYIDEAFPTEIDRDQALQNAFSNRKKEDGSSELRYDRLTLGDYINLVTNKQNWERFKGLESRTLFQAHLNHVRDIRNQLVHFRGRLDAVQYDKLRRAHDWLERRNLHNAPPTQVITGEPIKSNVWIGQGTIINHGDWVQGKYGPLRYWLENQAATAKHNHTFTLTFAQVEEIIGDTLPPSGRQHRAWWANDSTSSRQAEAWMAAGWAVEDVDFNAEVVKFKRTDIVLYQIFWANLAERIKVERPGFSRTSKSFAQNYCSYSSGKSGFSYVWSFSPNRDELWTQLVIDTRQSDSKFAKKYFHQLYSQKEYIEQEFGGKLIWDERPDKSAARIYASYPVRITDTPEIKENAKVWAVQSIQRLVDTMQSRIAELTTDLTLSSEISDDWE
jgi:CBS domain-containing protein